MERKGEGRDGGGQGMGENVVEEKEWADEDRGVCGGGGEYEEGRDGTGVFLFQTSPATITQPGASAARN